MAADEWEPSEEMVNTVHKHGWYEDGRSYSFNIPAALKAVRPLILAEEDERRAKLEPELSPQAQEVERLRAENENLKQVIKFMKEPRFGI